MRNFPESLKIFRSKNGLTQEETGKRLGVTGNYIYQLESGLREPSQGLLKLFHLIAADPSPPKPYVLSEVLDGETGMSVREDYEMPVMPPPALLPRMVPIMGLAHAGSGNDTEELVMGNVPSDCPDKDSFAVRIQGDSMEPRFIDGEIAIAMRSYQPRLHQYVLARTIDGVVFKIFNRSEREDQLILSSLNPRYRDIYVDRESLLWIHPVWQVIRNLWQA